MIETAVRGKVNPIDVLGYRWILTKAPRVAELIADHPPRCVDDPGDAEEMRRLSQEPRLSSPVLSAIGGMPVRAILS